MLMISVWIIINSGLMVGRVCFLVVLVVLMEGGWGHHLRLVSPASLVEVFGEKYHAGNIPFSIANYGEVPYGKTISGQIGLPTVLEDCIVE